MTQPEETPAEPVPAQPTEPEQSAQSTQPTQPTEAAQPEQPAEPTQPLDAAQPAEPEQAAQAQPEPQLQAQPQEQPADSAQPSAETVVVWAQPADPNPAQGEFAPAAPDVPVLSPEEQAAAVAAAAAKKAKRRGVFAKSAILAVPAVLLVALLVGAGIEVSGLSTKTDDASTAAKSAVAAAGLTTQLHAAESAAQASILVDPGCVAIEGSNTSQLESKLIDDVTALDKAANGTDYDTFVSASDTYINDLQSLSTSLQQDAALSKRSSLQSTVASFTGDLKILISTSQELMDGDTSNSVLNTVDNTATKMAGDATAVDTMCGGDTLDGPNAFSGGGNSGSSTTSA